MRLNIYGQEEILGIKWNQKESIGIKRKVAIYVTYCSM
jgi:hypothetical protein